MSSPPACRACRLPMRSPSWTVTAGNWFSNIPTVLVAVKFSRGVRQEGSTRRVRQYSIPLTSPASKRVRLIPLNLQGLLIILTVQGRRRINIQHDARLRSAALMVSYLYDIVCETLILTAFVFARLVRKPSPLNGMWKLRQGLSTTSSSVPTR